MSTYNPHWVDGESAAEHVRRRGWGPGTVLEGDEGYGPTRIRITAIGVRSVLAESPGGGYESTWTPACRDWQPVGTEQVTP